MFRQKYDLVCFLDVLGKANVKQKQNAEFCTLLYLCFYVKKRSFL